MLQNIVYYGFITGVALVVAVLLYPFLLAIIEIWRNSRVLKMRKAAHTLEMEKHLALVVEQGNNKYNDAVTIQNLRRENEVLQETIMQLQNSFQRTLELQELQKVIAPKNTPQNTPQNAP